MSDIFLGVMAIFAAGLSQWSGVERFGESFGLNGPPYAVINPIMFVLGGFVIGKGISS